MGTNPVRPPLPPPVRVLVKGASSVNWTSFMGGPRSDMAYPRVIEVALHGWGRPAEVRDTSFAAELAKHSLYAWQREVVCYSPDVVVLHYGVMECMHLVLPRWLQAHAQNQQFRRGPVRDLYRLGFIRPFWRLLARVQQRVDRRMPLATFAGRRRRVKRDLLQLVKNIRDIGSPLVLLMELDPPGETYARWFPGMPARIDLMNQTLRELVAEYGCGDVRVFPTRDVLERLTTTNVPVNSDGAHYTPAAHQALGQALAHEIELWVAHQGHLELERLKEMS